MDHNVLTSRNGQDKFHQRRPAYHAALFPSNISALHRLRPSLSSIDEISEGSSLTLSILGFTFEPLGTCVALETRSKKLFGELLEAVIVIHRASIVHGDPRLKMTCALLLVSSSGGGHTLPLSRAASTFACAQFAAISAGYASYPFDTVRRRLQMQSEKPKVSDCCWRACAGAAAASRWGWGEKGGVGARTGTAP
jgi:hypothetical protein